jgi:hypothetical protein
MRISTLFGRLHSLRARLALDGVSWPAGVRGRGIVEVDSILLAITEPMLRVRPALLEEFERLDRLCQQFARRAPVCRRLGAKVGEMVKMVADGGLSKEKII